MNSRNNSILLWGSPPKWNSEWYEATCNFWSWSVGVNSLFYSRIIRWSWQWKLRRCSCRCCILSIIISSLTCRFIKVFFFWTENDLSKIILSKLYLNSSYISDVYEIPIEYYLLRRSNSWWSVELFPLRRKTASWLLRNGDSWTLIDPSSSSSFVEVVECLSSS